MPQPIPEIWKQKVRAALDSDDPGRYEIRKRVLDDWQSLFPLAFQYELRATLSDALGEGQVMGVPKTMNEPAETYAFFVECRGKRLYAKIGLLPNGRVVIIYSTHLPDPAKGDKL